MIRKESPIIRYQRKLDEVIEAEKNKFNDKFISILDKYPIYYFLTIKDLEEIIKNIYENKDNEEKLVDEIFSDYINKTKKKRNKNSIDINDEIINENEIN